MNFPKIKLLHKNATLAARLDILMVRIVNVMKILWLGSARLAKKTARSTPNAYKADKESHSFVTAVASIKKLKKKKKKIGQLYYEI